ncbi:hypothetical protein [Corynebacterium macginleyi]|uniref:hypothetical protein n=1 Tax=Corynebacterium macginleyi TaxID=38290 RepID=UPI00190A8E1E|nr:hypothetical protein [Corynebacterium macginleyi]MBK4158270.1 hypothetical protein [Corynebacterium macginleyi]MBM0262619.1 hypothetical protein [Corynebacterium macginleyi]
MNLSSRKKLVPLLAALFLLFPVPFAQADETDTDPETLSPGDETILSPGQTFSSRNPVEISSLSSDDNFRVKTSDLTNYSADDNLAPMCVSTHKGFYSIQVENNCGHDLRVKVIMAFDRDSECNFVKAGEKKGVKLRYNPFGGVDRVILC